MKIDKKLIKELTDYLDEFKLTEIEYGNKDLKIKVSKSNSSVITTSINKPTISEKSNEKEKKPVSKITSPIIGTAYLAPEPNAKKFIEVGKKN